MKFNSIILTATNGASFTGFVEEYPGVIAQGKTVEEVETKLDKFLRLYFNFMSQSTFDFNTPVVEQLV